MTINEINTAITNYAYECGGNHHTNEEIQKDLLELSEELFKTNIVLLKTIQFACDNAKNLLGISDETLKAILRQENIESHKA
jgi:hypothetical protein